MSGLVKKDGTRASRHRSSIVAGSKHLQKGRVWSRVVQPVEGSSYGKNIFTRVTAVHMKPQPCLALMWKYDFCLSQ